MLMVYDSVAVPCIIVASVNAKLRWDAHWEHVAHEEHENPRDERPEYAYQNIRTKNYFWGDGDKVRSNFPMTNALTALAAMLQRCKNAMLTMIRPFSGTTRSTTTRRTSKCFYIHDISQLAMESWKPAQAQCVNSISCAQV
jgi:hypothetical protein